MMPPEQPEPARTRTDGNVTYLRTTFETRVRMLVEWEMRRVAREEVKRRLRAQGVKLSLTSRAQITRLAMAHLRAHSEELLAAAEASGAVQRLLREEAANPQG
jgi:hypothetical protein